MQEKGIANIILVGVPEKIHKLAEGLDISKCRIVNPETYEKFEEYANAFYELRKAKGMTPEKAHAIMKDYVYFATMMVKMGEADGMVSGAAHSTADTVRPSLQILKTKPGTSKVSAFFVMVVPNCEYGANGIFVYADSGLVENPSAEDLSDIAIESSKSFKQLVQEEPIVAMLSYSTYGSAKSELTEKVITATQMAKEKAPELMLDGELQATRHLFPQSDSLKHLEARWQGMPMYLYSRISTAEISHINSHRDSQKQKRMDQFYREWRNRSMTFQEGAQQKIS